MPLKIRASASKKTKPTKIPSTKAFILSISLPIDLIELLVVVREQNSSTSTDLPRQVKETKMKLILSAFLVATFSVAQTIAISEEYSDYTILSDSEGGIAVGSDGKTRGQVLLRPAFIQSIKINAGLNPFSANRGLRNGDRTHDDVMVQTTYLTSTSERHEDGMIDEISGCKLPVHAFGGGNQVGFIPVNTNKDAHLDVDDSCFPIEEGKLVKFDASSPHHTVVNRGHVNLIGPFQLHSMKDVGPPADQCSADSLAAIYQEFCNQDIDCAPSAQPSPGPSSEPSAFPSETPSDAPTGTPSDTPSISMEPSDVPSLAPSSNPSGVPSSVPSLSLAPTKGKGKGKGKGKKDPKLPDMTKAPSSKGKGSTKTPSQSLSPTGLPSVSPTDLPSVLPSVSPTVFPSSAPSGSPSTSAPTTDFQDLCAALAEQICFCQTEEDDFDAVTVPSGVPSLSVAPSEVPSGAPSDGKGKGGKGKDKEDTRKRYRRNTRGLSRGDY